MSPPWQVLIAGLVLGVVGGVMGAMAWSSEVGGLLMLSWGLVGLSGLIVFVGLVALAVEMGIRAAR